MHVTVASPSSHPVLRSHLPTSPARFMDRFFFSCRDDERQSVGGKGSDWSPWISPQNWVCIWCVERRFDQRPISRSDEKYPTPSGKR